MTEYELNLKNRIVKRLEVAKSVSDMLGSMIAGSRAEGKVNPVDLHCALSSYRSLVEATTLVKAYNESFSDLEIKAWEKELESVLTKSEEDLVDILKILARR